MFMCFVMFFEPRESGRIGSHRSVWVAKMHILLNPAQTGNGAPLNGTKMSHPVGGIKSIKRSLLG